MVLLLLFPRQFCGGKLYQVSFLPDPELILNKDPFDRLLIAQADIEKAILVSKDKIFTEYEIKVVW
jgi:PIN domain nuclease of toxin-antitoxin system